MQTRLGAIPYYMFIEQDTGPRQYFEVPLVKAYEIYKEARESTTNLVWFSLVLIREIFSLTRKRHCPYSSRSNHSHVSRQITDPRRHTCPPAWAADRCDGESVRTALPPISEPSLGKGSVFCRV